jgi:chromate reductase
MNLLLFSGSLRTDSLNKKLLAVANEIILDTPGNQCVNIDLKKMAIPLYDGDIETQGIPDGVQNIGRLIHEADGLVIASPEYNHSIASPLKNLIDWVSRLRPVPLENKPVFLMSASPGAFGGIRGISAARIPFEALSAFPFPQTFALAKASDAFTPTGDFSDSSSKQKLATLLKNYFSYVKKFGDEKINSF